MSDDRCERSEVSARTEVKGQKAKGKTAESGKRAVSGSVGALRAAEVASAVHEGDDLNR
jgi:hypothetical protein